MLSGPKFSDAESVTEVTCALIAGRASSLRLAGSIIYTYLFLDDVSRSTVIVVTMEQPRNEPRSSNMLSSLREDGRPNGSLTSRA